MNLKPSEISLPCRVLREVFENLTNQELYLLMPTNRKWNFLLKAVLFENYGIDYETRPQCIYTGDFQQGKLADDLTRVGQFVKYILEPIPVFMVSEVLSSCAELDGVSCIVRNSEEIHQLVTQFDLYNRKLKFMELNIFFNTVHWSPKMFNLFSNLISLTISFESNEESYYDELEILGFTSMNIRTLRLEVSFFAFGFYRSLSSRFPNLKRLSITGRLDKNTAEHNLAPQFQALEELEMEIYCYNSINPYDIIGGSKNIPNLKLLSLGSDCDFDESLLSEYVSSMSWKGFQTLILGSNCSPNFNSIRFGDHLTKLHLVFPRNHTRQIPVFLSQFKNLLELKVKGILGDESFNVVSSPPKLRTISLSGELHLSTHFITWLTESVPLLQNLELYPNTKSVKYLASTTWPKNTIEYFPSLLKLNIPNVLVDSLMWMILGAPNMMLHTYDVNSMEYFENM